MEVIFSTSFRLRYSKIAIFTALALLLALVTLRSSSRISLSIVTEDLMPWKNEGNNVSRDNTPEKTLASQSLIGMSRLFHFDRDDQARMRFNETLKTGRVVCRSEQEGFSWCHVYGGSNICCCAYSGSFLCAVLVHMACTIFEPLLLRSLSYIYRVL